MPHQPRTPFQLFSSRDYPGLGSPIVIVTDLSDDHNCQGEYFAFFEREENVRFGARICASQDVVRVLYESGGWDHNPQERLDCSFFMQHYVMEKACADLERFLVKSFASHPMEADLLSVALSPASRNRLLLLRPFNRHSQTLEWVRRNTHDETLAQHVLDLRTVPSFRIDTFGPDD